MPPAISRDSKSLGEAEGPQTDGSLSSRRMTLRLEQTMLKWKNNELKALEKQSPAARDWHKYHADKQRINNFYDVSWWKWKLVSAARSCRNRALSLSLHHNLWGSPHCLHPLCHIVVPRDNSRAIDLVFTGLDVP